MKLQLAEEMDSNGAVEHEALEELDTADLDSSAPDDGSAAKKVKKKKKRRAQAANFKTDAEKRFGVVVEQLKSREADDLWVSLGNCDIEDSKIASLTEALAQSATVTAVDLSRNNITASGAQALFEALKDGAAADLIELDLRGNPFSVDDLDRLAYLWKSRKQLNVLVGAQKAQPPTVSLSPFALQANEFVEVEEIEGVAKDSSPVPANASPLVLQFFQMGEDDERPNGHASQTDEPDIDADTMASELWRTVEELNAAEESSIAELGRTLREIAYQIQMEMDRCQLPMLDDTGLEDLKPHTLIAAQNLWQLPDVLDRVPPSVIWPISPSEAQVAVGTHRLGVAQILAQLASARALVLDEAMAKTGMLPKLVQLCFTHQGNNALHSTVVSLLRAAFSSKISSLWQPMFRIGMGIEAGSAAFPASPPPLQRQLAAVGIAAADMSCSRRPPVAGFVIAVATMVKTAAADGHASGILQDHLQDDEEWMEFVEEGGAHQRLVQEQEGCLYCDPPRASQPSLLSCGGLMASQHQNGTATANGSSLFNCRELMGMLHIPQLTGSPQG